MHLCIHKNSENGSIQVKHSEPTWESTIMYPRKILHSLQVWSYQWVMVDGLRCLPQSHSHEHVARVQQNPFLQQDTGHTKDQASRPPALLAGHADILDMCIYGKHLHVHGGCSKFFLFETAILRPKKIYFSQTFAISTKNFRGALCWIVSGNFC